MYNAQAIRQIRNEKDAKIRQTFRNNNRNRLPFVRTAQFADGQYRLRLWPADDKRNPLGFLRYKTHLIEKKPGGPGVGEYVEVQCPRSTNMDPLPTHYEDEFGRVYHQIIDGVELSPIFKLRCPPCEILEMSEEFKPQMGDGLSTALGYLAGGDRGDSYHWQMSVNCKVTSRTEEPRNDGQGTWTRIVYGPTLDPSELTHMDLTIPEGYSILDKLFRIITLCPDAANPMVGRWLWMMKQNGGSGANGYDLMCDPHPSPAGFELPANLYQDFSTWGKGGRDRPSKRLEFPVVEAHILQTWWADTLRQFGIPLTDAEAAQMEASPAAPYNPFGAF